MEIETRVCPVCSREYQVNPVRLRHGRQTTCGRACSYQLRAAGLSNGCEVSCSVCGAKFYRASSAIKSKHQGIYCSRECHYRGRRLGLTARVVRRPYVISVNYDREAAGRKAWETRRLLGKDRHSEATRERLREASIRHVAGLVGGHHVSKLEDKVAEELSRFGIPFGRQVGIRDPATGRYIASADFFLAGRVVLEVNGTFWHADPRTYPEGPRFPAQHRTVTRYGQKVAALARLSIPLVELWESDFAESPVNAVRSALNRAGL